MRRLVRSLALGSLAALLLAGTATAGGWGSAVVDPIQGDPPRAGEPTTIGFTLLQHGQTPVDWGAPTVTFTHPGSGQAVTAAARMEGDAGHWVVQVTLPADGAWAMAVQHDLEVSVTGSGTVTVGPIGTAGEAASTAAAVQPALLLAGAFGFLLLLAVGTMGFVLIRRGRLQGARA
jgi:hypothetical protein